MSNELKKEILSWIKTIAIAFIIAFILKTFIFRPVYVVGSSMEPTLSNKEVLFMLKLKYQFSDPDRGDIVVIKGDQDKLDHKSLIKRVIGLPGETVEIRNGEVYVNDKKLEPDYVDMITPSNGFTKTKIPEGVYFVMGDNRQNSRDSRSDSVGLIARKNIEGETIFRFWPFKKIGTI